jgi:ATP-dependent helicase STH1/SNF2
MVQQTKCLVELRRLTEDHPELANFEDRFAGDASGADTPLNAGTPGQPKLKLTFNNPNRDSPSTSIGADYGLGE